MIGPMKWMLWLDEILSELSLNGQVLEDCLDCNNSQTLSFCITYLHAVSETIKFPEFFDSEMLHILYFNDAKVYDIWLIANQYF